MKNKMISWLYFSKKKKLFLMLKGYILHKEFDGSDLFL